VGGRGCLLGALLVSLAIGDGTGQAQGQRMLTVMTFNVWYGGAQIDEYQVTRAIRRAGADIVGLQDPEGNVRRIARLSRLPYYTRAST
jgi:endonuclease/exonuclease/phosphatase family metal-dependent hydrolase